MVGNQTYFYSQTLVLKHAPVIEHWVTNGHKNDLDSLVFLPKGVFDNKSINLVTDEMQLSDNITGRQQLKLFFHVGHMVTCFLRPVMNSILPLESNNVSWLLEFPFSCSGKLLDHLIFGEDFKFFSDPVFGCKSMEKYSICNTADPTSYYKDFQEEGMYDLVYDTAQINMATDQLLTVHDDSPLAEAHVDFWACWML
jgi:hypothetical protein